MDISLLRLSPSARYALRGMAYLALQLNGHFSLVEEVAAAEKLPKDFLAKIFQRLAQRGLLLSRRGPGGGYALTKSADQVDLADVVKAIEGAGVHECFVELQPCDAKNPCPVHEAVVEANALLQKALEQMTLADLTQDNKRTSTYKRSYA